MSLIQTKLHPPDLHISLIERPFLIEQLNQNPNRRLTVVSAPAGFGKTTTITTWLVQQPQPFVWVSLDQYDNNVGTFLRYTVAAIQQILPTACLQLSKILTAPDLPLPETLSALVINELNQLPHPILLVFDDYHTIHNNQILQLVERILTHATTTHLVIISRADPLLPLPRLRLNGMMVELRQQELRFSDKEAIDFLQTAVSAPLNAQQIEQLNQQVEGWIAGLRLASISMQTSQANDAIVQKMANDRQGDIANYLFMEVLSQQPPHIQQFLLHTPFVERFSAKLCHALLPNNDSIYTAQSIITYLQSSNLFIISLDDSGEWFRYHHLFQQMLQHQAAQLGETAVLALHNRAGDYFAQEGHVDEALQHYLQAGNMKTAVSLIESNSHNLLNSLDRQRLEKWMEQLPDELIWQRPRLLVAKAWLFYRHWQLTPLNGVLNQLHHQLTSVAGQQQENDEQNFLWGQLYTLKSVTTFCLEQNFAQSKQYAEKALALLPASEQGALGTAFGYGSFSQQALGQYETAVSQLQQKLRDPAPQGPAWVQLYLGLTFIHFIAGDILASQRNNNQFLAAVQTNPIGIAPANWVAGIINYETNQLNKAKAAFSQTANLHFATNFLAACDSWLGLARICQIEGNLGDAQNYINIVRQETLRLDSQDLLPFIEGMEAYQAYLQGETATAQRWTTTFRPATAPDYTMPSFLPLFFWARILLAVGTKKDWAHAETILKSKLEFAQTAQDMRRQIQLLAHLTLLQTKLGKIEEARKHLKTAVSLAELGGFIRSILDCGSEIRPYLHQLQQEDVAPHTISQLLAAMPTNQVETGDPPELLLTRRESEILQRMSAGQSNKEIAHDLVISIYTVKRHASNIYHKLNVNSRRQAVFRAKQLGIIDSSTNK